MSIVESAALQLCHEGIPTWNLDRCPREDTAVLFKRLCALKASAMRDLSTICSFRVHQNVSDTCNTNTNTTGTRRLAKGRHCPHHSRVSAEHKCMNKLDCRILTHGVAQKELSYCLVEEQIE